MLSFHRSLPSWDESMTLTLFLTPGSNYVIFYFVEPTNRFRVTLPIYFTAAVSLGLSHSLWCVLKPEVQICWVTGRSQLPQGESVLMSQASIASKWTTGTKMDIIFWTMYTEGLFIQAANNKPSSSGLEPFAVDDVLISCHLWQLSRDLFVSFISKKKSFTHRSYNKNSPELTSSPLTK